MIVEKGTRGWRKKKEKYPSLSEVSEKKQPLPMLCLPNFQRVAGHARGVTNI